jgi:hypothetical protein
MLQIISEFNPIVTTTTVMRSFILLIQYVACLLGLPSRCLFGYYLIRMGS